LRARSASHAAGRPRLKRRRTRKAVDKMDAVDIAFTGSAFSGEVESAWREEASLK
jgi:hypothetical protein